MKFDPKAIQQGRQTQKSLNETPTSFATESGTDVVKPTNDLSKSDSRMAGQMGGRVMQLMNDPIEQNRTARWMAAFSLSNQGMQWNMAKMGLGQQQQG